VRLILNRAKPMPLNKIRNFNGDKLQFYCNILCTKKGFAWCYDGALSEHGLNWESKIFCCVV